MAWRRSGVRSPSAPPRWEVDHRLSRVGGFFLCPGEGAKGGIVPELLGEQRLGEGRCELLAVTLPKVG